MSHSSEERDEPARRGDQHEDHGPGISDDDLPEDLVPGEDNPLAEPLDDDVSRADLGMGTPGPTQHEGDRDDDEGSED